MQHRKGWGTDQNVPDLRRWFRSPGRPTYLHSRFVWQMPRNGRAADREKPRDPQRTPLKHPSKSRSAHMRKLPKVGGGSRATRLTSRSPVLTQDWTSAPFHQSDWKALSFTGYRPPCRGLRSLALPSSCPTFFQNKTYCFQHTSCILKKYS